MIESMVLSVVTWVIPRLPVIDSVLGRFWIISDPKFPSGFDPLFFLHHANVDRMLSLWSAVNPGVWVSPGPALQGGSFTIAANAPLDNKTSTLNRFRVIQPRYSQRILGLTPFWNSQTGFWASSEMATSAGLNYTYPEFNGLNLGNPKAVSTAIAAYINRQYGVGQFSSLSSAGPEVSILAQPFATEGASALAAHDAPAAHDATPASEAPNVIHDWAARIHAKKFELGHGYAVLIFLGDVPDYPEHWRTSPSFVGAHIAFVNTHTEQLSVLCRSEARA